MLETLAPLCAERGIRLDAAQERAAARLSRLKEELAALKRKRATWVGRYLVHPEPPRGVYLWGGVGRGKSFLMDAFYGAVPQRRKTRVHFHAFMREVHADLKTLRHEADPLVAVAERIAERYRLVCFDEFHVSDIADAMILGRLLANCFDLGVVFVMTSNYPPTRLYPDGLQRQNFLPTIDLILARMDVLEVDAGVDYRRRTLERERVYHWPADAAATEALERTFASLVVKSSSERVIRLLERDVPVVRCGEGVIWFTFATLCETPRSQLDYLELAQRHHTLILSDVPRLARVDANVIRRFTLLVDVLYDHRVKLILSAEAPLEELARIEETMHDGDTRRVLSEFARTASRLTEMQSAEYMGEPHIATLKR
ncbi:MAG: cell division protein ZapE [Casimicrobiaceae bacterium]